MDSTYRERFLRSIGIFTEAQLGQFKNKKIAVGGLGLGGSIFLNLVRMGFEKFHIADPDIFERTNINRQRLAKETTIGRRKDECSIEEAKAINPAVQVTAFPEGVKLHNLEAFLKGVDWVVDVVDLFAMSDKLALNDAAYAKGIPVSSCATLGFTGCVVNFNKKTPSFAELTGISNDLPYAENLKRFLQFICPEVPVYMQEQLGRAMDRSSYIPFVTPGGEISAAFAASEIAKQIVGLGKSVVAPKGIFVDAALLKVEIFEASHKARIFTPPQSGGGKKAA
jgi:molybdopterin/thiamine biosynthesis adenylyltransferase